jgi:O-antigen/teichoic acid export membrane protein
VAGLVTFPILTRGFSLEEYGTLSFLGAILAFFVTVAKTGIQHSVVRLFSQVATGKSEFSLQQLYSTTVFGMGASAALTGGLLIAAASLLPQHILGNPAVRLLLALISVLVLTQVLDSGLSNLLRAAERSTLLIKYQVGKKYLSIALILFGILVVSRSLTAFYVASILAEVIAIGLLIWHTLSGQDLVRPKYFSKALYWQMITYGVPMMIGYELSGVILSIGDRYVIKAIIGDAQLGLYSAAYNMCQYIGSTLVYSITQAIMPMYMRIWNQEGPEAASAFTSRSLGHYLLFVTPVVAGVASVGPYLLPALASEKYVHAGVVLPWIIGGMALDGASNYLGAGLYVERRPRLLMGLMTGSALLNVALNLLLVPRLGILGAAVSTLLCYLGIAVSFAIIGGRYLRVRMPWTTFLRAAFASVTMYWVLEKLEFEHRLLTIAVRGVAGVVMYAALILILDAEARSQARKIMDACRRRLVVGK